LKKTPLIVKGHHAPAGNVTNWATASDKFAVPQLVNRFASPQGVIDFLPDSGRNLAYNATEHDNVNGIY